MDRDKLISLAKSLAVVMPLGILSPESRALLTLAVAWPLSLILAGWYLRQQRDSAADVLSPYGLGLIYMLMDSRYATIATEFINRATAARDLAQKANAGGVFSALIEGVIGIRQARDLIRSERFRGIQNELNRDFPVPSEVTQSYSQQTASVGAPPMTRARRFDAFDFTRAASTTTPGDESDDLQFYRRELAKSDLSAEQRWFYEQKLEASGLPVYTSSDAARGAWAAMLKKPLPQELRAYFAEKLATLGGAKSLA